MALKLTVAHSSLKFWPRNSQASKILKKPRKLMETSVWSYSNKLRERGTLIERI